MSDIQPISKGLESSSGSVTDPKIDKIIDNLPKEFLEAMINENVLLVNVNVIKKTLSKVIYDPKKELLIKLLPIQINVKVPKSFDFKFPNVIPVNKNFGPSVTITSHFKFYYI